MAGTAQDRQERDVPAGALRHRSAPVARLAAVGVTMLAAGALAVTGVVGSAPAASVGTPRVLRDVPVTAMDQGVGWANNSPALVADPTDPRFVVMANRLDAPDFGCSLQVSGDGGRGWVTANPVPELPEGAEKCYAPEAAFDEDGTLYYLFMGLAGRGNEPMGAFLTTSTDRARTFSRPRRVLGPLNFSVRMAIDRSVGDKGRLHLVWLRAVSDPPLGGFGPPPNPILAAHSDDGGRTFSEPVQVSDADRELVVAPSLVLGPDGDVHVAYYDLEDDAVDYRGLEGPPWQGTWSVVVTSSSDGGRRFAEGEVVDADVVPHERVMLVFTMPPPALVAAGDARLCAAWPDARFGDADVLARCSSDGGTAWGPLRRLNDDPKGNGVPQFQPRLSATADGDRIDAVFYDRRDDPGRVLTDVYYTYSTDGGTTFARNHRLTTYSSDPEIGQRYTNVSARGLIEFGSRIGLLSLPGAAVAAWTDTRNSKPFTTGQDIFATTVRFPSQGHSSGWRPAGLALAATGAGLVALAAVGHRRPRPGEGEAHSGGPSP